MITLSAFRWVPPLAQGLVRDLRVRWALEEAGIPYQERLLGPGDQATAAYRALQPFGQVPAIEAGDLKLFESGAIFTSAIAAGSTETGSFRPGRSAPEVANDHVAWFDKLRVSPKSCKSRNLP